ncbi:MAG TPA: NAD-dependent epimerase/dehydratase family protein [Acidobacteria bacterium]|nr:NAD-dependent epimerase/dehydratase family protein [Acidobacteriota bacterium]
MTTYAPATSHRPVTALVTGGGGFVGRAVVDQLLARGDRVRSLARGVYPELAESGVDVLRGDLTDPDAVEQACTGCDVVFHVAAKAGIWGHYTEYYEANVRGTGHILAACAAHGVGRLVYTSSPSVVFGRQSMAGVDESIPYPRRHRSHYAATKALAEQAVLAANSATLRTVALRPHLIWGPRDNHIVPRLLAQARAGTLRRVGDGSNRVDTTYIDDAARAHLLAADALETNAGAAGRPFFISQGEPIPLWELIDRILATAGCEPVTRAVPRPVAWMVGGVLEAAYTLFRLEGEPRMTRFVADELATTHWFDITAARRELGYKPAISIAEGLRRLEAWLRPSVSS